MNEESLVFRLKKRAEIRRNIITRKSVREGKPDRISDLLEEAAIEIERLNEALDDFLMENCSGCEYSLWRTGYHRCENVDAPAYNVWEPVAEGCKFHSLLSTNKKEK